MEDLNLVGKHRVADLRWLDNNTILMVFQDEYPEIKTGEFAYYFNMWAEYWLDEDKFVFGVDYYDEKNDDFMDSLTDLTEEERYNMPPLDDEVKFTEEEKRIIADYLKGYAEEKKSIKIDLYEVE